MNAVANGTEDVLQIFLDVLGYPMQVASVEDVLQGKIWAYSDDSRRRSKRQKDLADILRLMEKYPQLERLVPSKILKNLP